INPVRDPEKPHALEEIALRQARAGDKKTAVETFNRAVKEIQGSDGETHRNSFLHYVATFQARAGLSGEAMQTTNLMQGELQGLARCNIATSEAQQGNPVGALGTYEAIPDNATWKPATLMAITTSLVKSGREAEAQALADKQESTARKAYAFLGIAEGFM